MRNQPRQMRSKRMVQTIMEATLDVVGTHGLDNTTTSHIAARAGISVGTLYHYFQNKQEIFSALQQRLSEEFIAAIGAATPTLVQKDFGQMIRGIAQLFIDELNRDNGKRLSFTQAIVNRGFAHQLREVEQTIHEFFLGYIGHHPELTQVRQLPRLTYILFNSMAFNLIRSISQPPPHITQDALLDGLSELAQAYVRSQMTPPGAHP